MPESLIELRKRPHLSISAVKSWLQCPRKFALQYRERARPDYLPAALILGSAWHSAVAGWLDEAADDEALDDQLRDDLRDRLRRDDLPVLFDDADEDADSFIERAVAMFKTFRGSVAQPKMVLGTEIAFATAIAHPQTGEVLPVPVIGAMDAIVVEEDGVGSLWELKTAKKKWSPDQAEFDPQVTLYRRAARELGYNGVRLRILVTTKTREPAVQVLNVARNDGDEAELAELFFEVHRAIEAGIGPRQRGWACRTCQYASSCRP
ncbi:MAG: PD-(D/E)XK nuclease family protein [Labilithrix sp.]|nr:PD-(D/E)XK nuclease family protein [Labilithrix sp.]